MTSSKSLTSAYIHIPFCKSKCHYCNFVSFAGKEACAEAYFAALKQEISFDLKELKTLYIGGGTPSIIPEILYEKLLLELKFSDSAEVTIEINPGAVSPEYLQALRQIGFNRLSIGAQNFDNGMLKTLNRQHTGKDSAIAVKNALNAGFENISIDLIYGLPGQTLSSWEKTLTQATKLNIKHISTYGLKIEEDTKFYRNLPENLPDEDITSQMYLKTIEILEEKGFNHYEISNFAKPSFESRHNLVYWNNEEYYGFGLAAHGYVDGVRYANSTNFEEYIENPLQKFEEKKLTTKEILEEAIFLGLRLRKGLNIPKFKQVYAINLLERYGDIIKKYTAQDLMEFDGETLKLTAQGVLLSNFILADFL